MIPSKTQKVQAEKKCKSPAQSRGQSRRGEGTEEEDREGERRRKEEATAGQKMP